jgi:hypothetical protein
MPLTYPYPPAPPGQVHHLCATRIPKTDFLFIKRLLPYVDGLSFNLQANLLKKFIDELRRIDSVTPLQPTLYPGDPTQQLVESLLDGITFGPVGRSSGPDVEHGAGGVREEVRPVTQQRPESQCGTPQRKRRVGRKGDKEKGERS